MSQQLLDPSHICDVLQHSSREQRQLTRMHTAVDMLNRMLGRVGLDYVRVS
jgi:hypothetical protein